MAKWRRGNSVLVLDKNGLKEGRVDSERKEREKGQIKELSIEKNSEFLIFELIDFGMD